MPHRFIIGTFLKIIKNSASFQLQPTTASRPTSFKCINEVTHFNWKAKLLPNPEIIIYISPQRLHKNILLEFYNIRAEIQMVKQNIFYGSQFTQFRYTFG